MRARAEAAGGAFGFTPLTPSDGLFSPIASPPSKAAYASPSTGPLKGALAFVTSAPRPVTTHQLLGSLRMVDRLSPPRNVRHRLRPALRARRAPHEPLTPPLPATDNPSPRH